MQQQHTWKVRRRKKKKKKKSNNTKLEPQKKNPHMSGRRVDTPKKAKTKRGRDQGGARGPLDALGGRGTICKAGRVLLARLWGDVFCAWVHVVFR